MVRVRPGVLEDAEAMVAVNAAGWRAAYRGLVPDEALEELPVERWRTEISGGLAHPVGDAFSCVGEVDGEFAGYAWVAAPARDEDLGADCAELGAMYVEPRHWKRGVGSALIAAAEAGAGERGYARLVVWTFERNERAVRFYGRHGFAPDGASRHYRLGGAPTVRLTKELAAPGDPPQ